VEEWLTDYRFLFLIMVKLTCSGTRWFPHKSCIFSGLTFPKSALQKCVLIWKLFRNWSFRTTLIYLAV